MISPASVFVSLAVFAAGLGLGGWALHSAGYQAGVADSNLALTEAKNANDASQLAIAGLRLSVTTCERNRIVDQAAQDRALADRKAQLERAEKVYDTAREQLSRLMSGQCKEWAKQAACGSVP